VAAEDPAPADNIPPFMTDVSITPSTAQVTESFMVSVGATDNSAGVYRIYCVLESPTNQSQGGSIGQIITMFLNYNSATKKWEKAEKLRPYDAEQGEWMLNNIALQDKRGNIRRYERISEPSGSDINYCDLKSITGTIVTPFAFTKINVTAPPADNTAPEMLSISVDETDTTTTRDILISIDATDDLSCVKSMTCKVESPTEQSNPGTGGEVEDVYFSYNSSTSMWQGYVSFDYGAETDDWMINTIVIEDYAGNSRTYERLTAVSTTNYCENSIATLFPYIIITVTPSVDVTAPFMAGLYVNPVDTGTTRDITISIDAIDEFSGAAGITCIVESPLEQLNGGGTNPLINVTLTYNSSSELWEGIASIPAGAEIGSWMINNITIDDNAGNTRLYDRYTETGGSDTNYYDETTSTVSLFEFVTIDVIN